jgi:hypothetical protein
MKPTLLVLAAGMGSRHGGLRRIDPVGPGGEIERPIASGIYPAHLRNN